MTAGDFLYRVGATGKKRICNAWNDEANNFGLLAPERPCGVIRNES